MSNVKKQTEPTTINSTVDALLQQLRDSYTAAVAKLESERDALEQESQGNSEQQANELRIPLPAQAREAQRQADKLLLQANPKQPPPSTHCNGKPKVHRRKWSSGAAPLLFDAARSRPRRKP
jgi:hypothetical protein